MGESFENDDGSISHYDDDGNLTDIDESESSQDLIDSIDDLNAEWGDDD